MEGGILIDLDDRFTRTNLFDPLVKDGNRLSDLDDPWYLQDVQRGTPTIHA